MIGERDPEYTDGYNVGYEAGYKDQYQLRRRIPRHMTMLAFTVGILTGMFLAVVLWVL